MRRVLPVVSLLLAACASNPLSDPGFEPPRNVDEWSFSLFVDGESPHRPKTLHETTVPGAAYPFRLVAERVVNGHKVPAGTVLWGLRRNGSWLRQPEFIDAYFWRADFAMVKRVGDERWTRLDFATGEELPMPFRHLGVARRRRFGFDGGRTVGFDADPQAPGLAVAYLLDRDWRVAQALHRVVPATVDAQRGFSLPQPVDALDTAYVVHHQNEAGVLVDVVYDLAGQPLSPELSPLCRLLGEDQLSPIRFAIRTDPIDNLYWPLSPDGRVAPKPADVCGIKLLQKYDGNTLVLWGGVAVARHADGERYAFINPSNWYGEHVAQLARASNYAAMEVVEYQRSDSTLRELGFVVKRVREDDWHLVTPSGTGIIGHGNKTREAALQLLAGYTRRNAAEYLAEWERRRAAYEEAITWRERRAAQEARHEQAVKDALAALQTLVDQEDVAGALSTARSKAAHTAVDCEAFLRLVLRLSGDTKVTVKLEDLELAHRTATHPDQQSRLLAALQRCYPGKYPVTRAVASGGGVGSSSSWSGSSSAGSSSPAAPTWSGPSVSETMANMRWQSQVNYLSGQTNFYFGSNGVVRR